MVRVGGGFMHIEEFINQYTSAEVERIERKDVMSRFSNKIAIQNISAHQSVYARESSPIRSPQRPKSPEVMRSPGRKI
tara:strand:+ start:1523 stop:1756 length:234 start_codon:yes stop_codon:yes gene_type:complete